MKYLLRRLLGISVFEKQEYLMSSSLTFTPGSTVPYGKGVRKHFQNTLFYMNETFKSPFSRQIVILLINL